MFDNKRPQSPLYPKFTPREPGAFIHVQVGDYIVNRDGFVMVATTSNAGPWPNEFLRSCNEYCFRAQYIGNRDDSLEFANQCRLATPEEKAHSLLYKPSDIKVGQGGQVLLF